MSSVTKFLPKDVISSIAETYQSNISTQSQAIYLTMVIALFALVISLPFVTISINVKSSALIRLSSEVSAIQSLVNGRVKEIFIIENQPFKKEMFCL